MQHNERTPHLVVRRLPSSRSSASIVMACAGHTCAQTTLLLRHVQQPPAPQVRTHLLKIRAQKSKELKSSETRCMLALITTCATQMALRSMCATQGSLFCLNPDPFPSAQPEATGFMKQTHRLAELARDTALLASRVAPQHVLAAEARADRPLLKRVVYLAQRPSHTRSMRRSKRQALLLLLQLTATEYKYLQTRRTHVTSRVPPQVRHAHSLCQARTVTFLSKKALSVSIRPRTSSVMNSVCALSSSTPARSLGGSRCTPDVVTIGLLPAHKVQAASASPALRATTNTGITYTLSPKKQ